MHRLSLPAEPIVVARQIWHALKAEVEARYCRFVSDKALEANMLEVAKLLSSTEDRRFGILLTGYTGTGKTAFANALRVVINSYNLIVDPEAVWKQRYIAGRYTAKTLWKRGMKDPDALSEIANSPAIMIDDLGEDAKEAVLFGNVLTPMIDLFEYRYERRLFTIATTNLPPSELLAKYDERVASRLNEMMLVLKFTGQDYRIGPSSIEDSTEESSEKKR